MKVDLLFILNQFVVGHFAIGGGWPGVDRRRWPPFDPPLVAARPAIYLCSVFILFIYASIRSSGHIIMSFWRKLMHARVSVFKRYFRFTICEDLTVGFTSNLDMLIVWLSRWLCVVTGEDPTVGSSYNWEMVIRKAIRENPTVRFQYNFVEMFVRMIK